MNVAVIEIGSNINPKQNINVAIEKIEATFNLTGRSKFIFTKPVGDENQSDYLNGAVVIQTLMDIKELKSVLKDIENTQRQNVSDAKTNGVYLDLDIILWNGNVVHEDYYSRDFVRSTVEEALKSVFL